MPDTDDPIGLFSRWMQDAQAGEPHDADAAALATADAAGLPDVRIVLVKKFDAHGFIFFTNAESAKGRELAENPKAALVFYWKSLNRQVRVRGMVERISARESDDYFASRPRGAQVGAWASQQSRPLANWKVLEAAVEHYEKKYAGKVPRPPHWTGYRLTALAIEFWADRPFRLHHRLVFTRSTSAESWARERLYP